MANLFYASLLYLGFVIGGVVPFFADDEGYATVRAAFLFFVLVAFLLPCKGKRAILLFSAKYVVLSALLLVPLVFFATDTAYAFQKIEAIVLGVIVCFLMIAFLLSRAGWYGLFSSMVNVALVILVLTLAYKSVFGFWSREVRFLLNGPIVFGWLMGVHGVVAMILWERSSRLIYALFVVVFFSAVVWTQSKGPLVAFVFSIFFLVFSSSSKDGIRTKVLFLSLGLVLMGWLFQDELAESLEGSRLQAISNVITGNVQENDEGSIGSRADMVDEVVYFLSQGGGAGIGVGDWQFRSKSGLKYPHNQHLEILVEMGGLWFLAHVGFLLVGFYYSDRYLRAILVFFLVAANFSGDASYLRYAYPFVLVGISVYGIRILRVEAWGRNEGWRGAC